jgi:hypothetical protein
LFCRPAETVEQGNPPADAGEQDIKVIPSFNSLVFDFGLPASFRTLSFYLFNRQIPV